MKNTEPRSLDEILTAAKEAMVAGWTPHSLARETEKLIREAYDRGRKDARWS